MSDAVAQAESAFVLFEHAAEDGVRLAAAVVDAKLHLAVKSANGETAVVELTRAMADGLRFGLAKVFHLADDVKQDTAPVAPVAPGAEGESAA